MENSANPQAPFADGDISAVAAYEYHEEAAFWQIAVDYAPAPRGSNAVDYVVTPQVNLLFKDRMYHGGVGALVSYVGKNESEWSDIYWQFVFGVGFKMSRRLEAAVDVYYPFESWSKLDEFKFEDLEFGACLKYSF